MVMAVQISTQGGKASGQAGRLNLCRYILFTPWERGLLPQDTSTSSSAAGQMENPEEVLQKAKYRFSLSHPTHYINWPLYISYHLWFLLKQVWSRRVKFGTSIWINMDCRVKPTVSFLQYIIVCCTPKMTLRWFTEPCSWCQQTCQGKTMRI